MVDRLNNISYAYHYRNIDSVETYARKAYKLSTDYGDGRAEALNNLAFVSTIRMDYEEASSLLSEVSTATSNSVELFVAAVQQMRLCQRMSSNRNFYICKEEATKLLDRINEDRGSLDDRQRKRFVYAETEFAIVSSAYYFYVGLRQASREALEAVAFDGDIRRDTAQYLNYLYNVGAGGIVMADSPDEVAQREFEALLECFFTARDHDYVFFSANALEAMAEHLLDKHQRQPILDRFKVPIASIVQSVDDCDSLAGRMADTSLTLFKSYGDVYQIAGAHRTLASCYMSVGDYDSALHNLEEALADTVVNLAPELVASIREQLSVAYSAINDKASSDYNRNVYLDLQERTRQDRSLEARAEILDRTVFELNAMIAAVSFAIVLLLFLLWLFSFLYHRERRANNIDHLLAPLLQWQKENERYLRHVGERREEMAESSAESEVRRTELERRNMDSRAKVALADSVVPLIDRVLSEVGKLRDRKESADIRAERYYYIAELMRSVNQYNDVLTRWIQLRQGMVSLHIESFALQSVFDIVSKGSVAFRMKNVSFEVRPTKAVVKADRVLTLFMVNTLADNARKFTRAEGRVCLFAEETVDYVEVSVSDTGCGLSKEDIRGIFGRSLSDDHGFGLINCRGIIDKYRKTSRLFDCCVLSVDSEQGRGSRFFFRLPHGLARVLLGATCLLSTSLSYAAGHRLHLSDLSQAAAFADSAYFSNVAGTYTKTLRFADSCRHYLNLHYRRSYPQSRTLMRRNGNSALLAPEVKWFRDSVSTNYNVILDIRNESAVAALALHDWSLYEYNNRVYTLLLKELSADKSLEDYCRVMQQSQVSKTITVALCLFVLLLIIPAYYMLYYRHRLYYRFCVERVESINSLLLDSITPEEKLMRVEPFLKGGFPEKLNRVVERIVSALREAVKVRGVNQADLELAEDELNRSIHEANMLYVCNAVLDNCLSALKHETMYYPNRILQVVESRNPNIDDLYQTVAYYRELCTLLGCQARRQLEQVPFRVSSIAACRLVDGLPSDVFVVGNANTLTYVFDILRRCYGGMKVTVHSEDNGYVVFELTAHVSEDPASNHFVPSMENIPYMICRQIIRLHAEVTNRRGCGIFVSSREELTFVSIKLPKGFERE